MNYDCTKPLGNRLEEYLTDDIDNILNEFLSTGIVFEHQFPTLWSMICKKNASDLCRLFTSKTGLEITYTYDNITCNFVFFYADIYSAAEAKEKSVEYQTKIEEMVKAESI